MDFVTTSYHLKSKKIAADLRLVYLSDLHSHSYGDGNRDLIAAIKDLEPDLILCGGDMLIAREAGIFQTAADLLTALRKIAPVALSNGNHESETRNYPSVYQTYEKLLKRGGVTVLNNQSRDFVVNGTKIRIYGLELPLSYYKKLKVPHLKPEVLKHLIGPGLDPKGDLSILLAHNPQFMGDYLNWGADLTLCGHFHGGIMRLGGNRILVSPYGFPFPKFGYGKFENHGKCGIVTSGLGEHVLPFRIHNPKELVFIELERYKHGTGS